MVNGVSNNQKTNITPSDYFWNNKIPGEGGVRALPTLSVNVGQGNEPCGFTPDNIIPIQTSYFDVRNAGFNLNSKGMPWFNAVWVDYSRQDRRYITDPDSKPTDLKLPYNLGYNEDKSLNFETVFPSPINLGINWLANRISEKLIHKKLVYDDVLSTMIVNWSIFKDYDIRYQPTAYDQQKWINGFSLAGASSIFGMIGMNASLTQTTGTVSPSAGDEFPFRNLMLGLGASYIGFNGRMKYTVSIGSKGGWWEQPSTAGTASGEVGNPYFPYLPSVGGSDSQLLETDYDIKIRNWERDMKISFEYGGFRALGTKGLTADFSAVQQKLMRQEEQSIYNINLGLGGIVRVGYTIYENMIPECDPFATGQQTHYKFDLGLTIPLTEQNAQTTIQLRCWNLGAGAGNGAHIAGFSAAVSAKFNIEMKIFGWKPFERPRVRDVEEVNNLIAPPVFLWAALYSRNNAAVLLNFYYRYVIEKALNGELNYDGSIMGKEPLTKTQKAKKAKEYAEKKAEEAAKRSEAK